MSQASNSALVQVSALRLNRARRAVLDIDELIIERGQFILLTGANGAGKTTLLKVLAGLLRADSAFFHCLGTAMSVTAAAKFCRGRHIYLHQTPYLFDTTVAENIAYGLKQRGRDPEQRRIEIRDALGWAKLEHLIDRPARELSTGERQRVALTRARILSPSLLLLDEITANMDSDSRLRSFELIDDLRRSGSSVVYATHNQESVIDIADASVELTSGRIQRKPAAAADVIPLRRDHNNPDGPGA